MKYLVISQRIQDLQDHSDSVFMRRGLFRFLAGHTHFNRLITHYSLFSFFCSYFYSIFRHSMALSIDILSLFRCRDNAEHVIYDKRRTFFFHTFIHLDNAHQLANTYTLL